MSNAGLHLERFKSRLRRLLPSAISFAATCYRSSTPKYATEIELLTGAGSQCHGGRWNPIGIACVYASLTPETAMGETLAHHRYYGIPIEDAMPRIFVAIDAQLSVVLDFRDGRTRQRLQLSKERLLAVDWRKEIGAGREPITQVIGRAAHEAEWEGLIVPSAADPEGHNLVIFPDKLQHGIRLTIFHADRLSPE